MSLGNKDPFVYHHHHHQQAQHAAADDLQDVCLNDDAKAGDSSYAARAPLPAGSRPEALKGAAHECLFVALIALAAATPVFLQRSVVPLAASISVHLHMSPAEMAWITASSGLTTGAFLLPFGHIADTFPVFPRKMLLVVSLVVFALLVVCTSFAPNGVVLDVLSGLTGAACAANVPVAVGILSLMYPVSSRRKNLVFSSFLMGTPVATIVGGLGSGALALKLSWKAPFICLAGLYAVVSALAWVFVPNVQEPETTPREEKPQIHILTERHSLPALSIGPPRRKKSALLQFDWLGTFLIVTGVLLFTVSLSIGPEGPEFWKTPTVIMLLTLGMLLLGCFVLWENVTSTPMIPPAIWKDWSFTLMVCCAVSASMAFYSQLFWVSVFMQQLENLRPFDIALRLLPQALVGLLVSPLVGLIMHRVPGTVLLGVAASVLTCSNILLIFLRQGDKYLFWILPSLMLSTIGMDWIMNIGSLHILSSLPLKHHSAGASLLQAASRLAVPLGMSITTSIWSSYDGMGDLGNPELAYANAFKATTAFSALALLIVPFIRIGKQGGSNPRAPDHESSMVKPSSPSSSPSPFPTPAPAPSRNEENRPSKRWSPLDTLAPSSTLGDRPPTMARSVSSFSSHGSSSADTRRTTSTARTTIRRGRSPSEKVVWMVCEECGTSKLHSNETTTSSVGDPTRYFNDPSCGGGGGGGGDNNNINNAMTSSNHPRLQTRQSRQQLQHDHHNHHHMPHLNHQNTGPMIQQQQQQPPPTPSMHHIPGSGGHNHHRNHHSIHHPPHATARNHHHHHHHQPQALAATTPTHMNQVVGVVAPLPLPQPRPNNFPPGRKRLLPLENRQIMTHQMLTQGYQP
ncbi:MFS general substrate transporter [Xylariomycetidae sp. FL2044]|nr:MFS general substrate transporter [Xylariomycetidae sp. FL2044]